MLKLVETRRTLKEKEAEVDELAMRLNTMHSKLNAVQDDLKLEKDKTAQLNKEIEYLHISKKILENVARKGENSEGGEAESGGKFYFL
jgi:septal ring factor EnvC (AmiA/AmiB activator)